MNILDDFIANPAPYNKAALAKVVRSIFDRNSHLLGEKTEIEIKGVDETKINCFSELNNYIFAHCPPREKIEKVIELMIPSSSRAILEQWLEEFYEKE